jgi:hypothetical protein
LYKYAAAINPPLPAYRDYEPPATPRDGYLLCTNCTDDPVSQHMCIGGQSGRREDAYVVLRVAPRSTTRIPAHWALSLIHSCPQLVIEQENPK